MIIYIKKKTAGIVVGFAFLLFVGLFLYEAMFNFSVSVSTEISNWGLSFREEGKAPVGNASAKALKEYNAYYVGDDSEKVIYLTFDAGFENGHTSKILDTLKKHDVKATFFLVGHYIEQEPQLVMWEITHSIIRICLKFPIWKPLKKSWFHWRNYISRLQAETCRNIIGLLRVNSMKTTFQWQRI